ncbi:long-chain-fatty-acid--CoA ligase [Ampullimonas aquatilis]|uniref:long-chain-fatty-acid--CoA ligase n=1 Tax=Ampullimonas aquatilis TaxID=1341549 RepID=UPI003C76F09C
MDPLWLNHYPADVPRHIDTSGYSSLTDLIDKSCIKYKERVAYISMGVSMTYGELDEYSCQLAAWMQSQGIARGARVAIMMPNILQYPITMYAALRAGYIVVNVNPLYTPRELEHQLKDSGAQAIVILENFAHTLEQVISRTAIKRVVLTSLGDMLGLKGHLVNFVVQYIKKLVPHYVLPGATRFSDALRQGASLPFSRPQIGYDDLAFLQYTGGTTGIAKGAMLSHKNVLANTLQAQAWNQPAIDQPFKVSPYTTVSALPLYHIYALTVCGLMALANGATNLLIANPRDIPAFIKELSRNTIHCLPAVNTLYNALLNSPDFDKVDWSHLRIANAGGMSVHHAVAERWLAKTGTPIIEGYGLTEASPTVTCNPVTAKEYNGMIGLPLPDTELSIRDDAGRELPIGETGELCVRGPQIMVGYWNRPDETAQVMTADGFLKTGDIAVMDSRGYTRLVDRKKDLILVSGFKVFPNELEDLMTQHPEVLEVAAIGIPDEHSGEVVKLFIVKRHSETNEDSLREDIFAFCKEQLTGYKRPRQIEFRRELPKTAVGKILRRELRDAEMAKSQQGKSAVNA